MFVHMVFFWLNDSADEAARDALINDCRGLLTEIPAVKHLWAGTPANTPRDVVDNSYDVGLCVTLSDRAAHDEYQAHDLHKQFIETHNAHWERVQVYDFA